jgi:hypothetical protein
MAEDENEDQDEEHLDSIDNEEQNPGHALYTITARDPKKVHPDKVCQEPLKGIMVYGVMLFWYDRNIIHNLRHNYLVLIW